MIEFIVLAVIVLSALACVGLALRLALLALRQRGL